MTPAVIRRSVNCFLAAYLAYLAIPVALLESRDELERCACVCVFSLDAILC